MTNKDITYIKENIDFKYDGINTYFCIGSLPILFIIFSSFIVFGNLYKPEELKTLFFLFVGFILIYFYIGTKTMELFYNRAIVKALFKEINEQEKLEKIISLPKVQIKKHFGYYESVCNNTNVVYITRKKPIVNRRYEITEINLSEQKIYFAREIKQEIYIFNEKNSLKIRKTNLIKN